MLRRMGAFSYLVETSATAKDENESGSASAIHLHLAAVSILPIRK
jgi:hypothetical protein